MNNLNLIIKKSWLGALIALTVYFLHGVLEYLVGTDTSTFTAFVGFGVLVVIGFFIIGHVAIEVLKKIFDHVEIG